LQGSLFFALVVLEARNLWDGLLLSLCLLLRLLTLFYFRHSYWIPEKGKKCNQLSDFKSSEKNKFVVLHYLGRRFVLIFTCLINFNYMKKILLSLAIFLFSGISVLAQTRTITGTIVDASGQPVEGASVQIKGSNVGTSANQLGQFSITAKQGDVLVISSVNFSDTEVKISTQNSISVTLQPASSLAEVVVTAFGIKRSEKAIGYAVTTVDPSALVQKSEPDLLKNLQGTVPGVDIRTSQGTPGAATRIQIRGNSSFGLETQPLFVVDGVPFSNDQITTSSQTSGGTAYGSGISDLDPNDIETFTVLKGAAAAALYGSRASRGVVLITTKSGSAKKGSKPLNVSLRSSFSLETIANLPDYQNSYGAGSQLLYQNANGSWGPKFGSGNVYDGGGNIIGPSASGIDSVPAWPEYLAAYPELFGANGNMAYVARPNNVKDLFRTGSVYENSISVNGGDANSSIALTASNLMHNGYVEKSNYIKNNLGLGGQTKFNNLTLGGNFSYSRSQQNGSYFGENQVDGASSIFARSLFLARNWDLSLPYQDALGRPIIPNGGAQFDNPHWAARNNVATTIEQRIITGIRLGYKVNNWINLSYNFGTNTMDLSRDEITQEFSRAANGLGRIVEDHYTETELQSSFVATFNPKIGTDFSLDLKLGNDINQRISRRQTNTGLDFVVPKIYSLKNTATQSFDDDSRFKQRLVGFFADATLGYRNFAFINVSGRNDLTSTLPYKNASYFYPQVSGSLVWTDAFNLKSNWLDYGKIRVGWAKVGNDAPSNQGQDVFQINPNFLGQPTTSQSTTPSSPDGYISQTVDANLTPEFTKEWEGGLDLSLFKRRVDIDATVYRKITTDLIYAVDIPRSTGYSSFLTNIGEISNKGIEIGLTIRPIVTDNFLWELRGAFTKNENIVVKLAEGLTRTALGGGFTGGIQTYLEPGLPFGYLYGTKVDRTADGLPLIDPSTGMMIESIEPGYVGNPNPDYKLGISNNISYKGFSLSFLFDMTQGGDISSVTITSLLGRGVTQDTKDRDNSLWVIPGVYGDPNSHEPILVGGKTVPNQTRITTNDLYFSPGGASASFGINASDEYNIWDATVYRLRDLTLGYDFPKTLASKLGLSGVRFSVSGHNLWYLAPNVPKYTNFDPEVSSYGSTSIQGLELSAAPTTRRVGVNLSVTF
jgi:TonB-linked SusC/RagA family outer membrane protein